MSIRYAREVNPICGACFASSANRCCFVDTGLEFRCLRRIALQRIHNPTPRFPPRGPGGSRIHVSAVLSRRYDFRSSLPPRFVAFAWRYHSVRLAVRSRHPKTQRWRTGSALGSATPTQVPNDPVETTGSPKFSGNPHCPFAHVLRPRQDCMPLTIAVQQCGPRKGNSKGSCLGTFEVQ